MQVERGALHGLPHHTKLITFKIPSKNSYKSTRRPFLLNYSSKFVSLDTYIVLKISKFGKCDIKLGLFLDNKLFLEITGKIKLGEY